MTGLWLAGRFWSGFDPLLLADHLAHFLIKPFSFDPGAHGGFRPDGVCPYPVCRVPPVSCLLHRVDDCLARLVLGSAFTKLDRHLAVLLALEEADAGKVVFRDAEGIGGGYPFPLSNPVGEALAVCIGFGCWRFGRWCFGDLLWWWFLLIVDLVCVYVTYDPPVFMGPMINPY